MNQHQPQASEYDMAMGRDAHARAEIDRAAAGIRQRQADREAGA